MIEQGAQPQRTDVNTLGEFGLIEHLTRRFPLLNASSVVGIGDDAAVIDNGNFKPSFLPICCSKASTST